MMCHSARRHHFIYLFILPAFQAFLSHSCEPHCFGSFKHWGPKPHMHSSMYVCKVTGLEVFANQPGAKLQWAERRKCLSKPGSHSRRQRRLESVLVISQGAMLWRTWRHWKVWYQGWTDNSDVNKRLLLGTWIAHQAAQKEVKGRLQTPRKKEHPYPAEVFQPHLDGNWKERETDIWTGIIFWSKLMQWTEEEVQEDFDGWSASCVFEEQRKSLEMNAFIRGSGVKIKAGGRWGRPETERFCWLQVSLSEQDERVKGPTTVTAEVTDSPLQMHILWLTCSFHFVLMPFKIFFFFFLSFERTDCWGPESYISKMIGSSPTILTVIVPGWINNPVV